MILSITYCFEPWMAAAFPELADKLSRNCRRIMASHWYRRIFPTRLSPERQAASEFETTAQGCRIATSIGGGLTGRGADLIILDDPLKPEEALSQTRRRATNEWFDHTLYSRLNDKENGAIILIMHRLHERLSSGLTRGTIWSAMYWRRRIGRWCAFGDRPGGRNAARGDGLGTQTRDPAAGRGPAAVGRLRVVSGPSATKGDAITRKRQSADRGRTVELVR